MAVYYNYYTVSCLDMGTCKPFGLAERVTCTKPCARVYAHTHQRKYTVLLVCFAPHNTFSMTAQLIWDDTNHSCCNRAVVSIPACHVSVVLS